MQITKIDTYTVVYATGTMPRRVWLRAGNAYIGQLLFMPDGSPLPQDTQSGSNINLWYHLGDFQNVIDLLRNEEPMFLLYMAPGGENGLMSSSEWVGEGEVTGN